MARYIDADALKLDIDLSKGASVLDMALSVIKAVKDAPTYDVVEVVRCMNCKYNAREQPKGVIHCHKDLVCGFRKPTDFCSYGERKE